MLVVLISEKIEEIKNEDLLNPHFEDNFLSHHEREKEEAWHLFLEKNILMFFLLNEFHHRRTLLWHKVSLIELLSSLDESEKVVLKNTFISMKVLRESFERLYFPDDD